MDVYTRAGTSGLGGGSCGLKCERWFVPPEKVWGDLASLGRKLARARMRIAPRGPEQSSLEDLRNTGVFIIVLVLSAAVLVLVVE